jgi:hypothetical protein
MPAPAQPQLLTPASSGRDALAQSDADSATAAVARNAEPEKTLGFVTAPPATHPLADQTGPPPLLPGGSGPAASSVEVLRHSAPRIERHYGLETEELGRLGGFYAQLDDVERAAELQDLDVAIAGPGRLGFWLLPLARVQARLAAAHVPPVAAVSTDRPSSLTDP